MRKIKKSFFLLTIILITIFFRSFEFASHFAFDADQEINSFIVKDILVDRHIRLIGQMNSIQGFFAGALFDYIQVPFFWLFKLDPIASIIPTILIGVLTVISIYFVFNKFINKNAAKIGSLLYAVSIPIVITDRTSLVPSQLVFLWSIWFLYCLFKIAGGSFKFLILAAFLTGLVWHIHPSLIPLLMLIPISIFLSRKKPDHIHLIYFFGVLFFMLIPFFLFEIKHDFIIMKSLAKFFFEKEEGLNFIYRIQLIITGSTAMVSDIFFKMKPPAPLNIFIFLIAFFYLKKKNILGRKFFFIITSWIIFVLIFQLISKRSVSLYYFNNLIIISLAIFSAVLSHLNLKLKGKLIPLLVFILLINTVDLLKLGDNPFAYKYKKEAVKFIRNDALARRYPCIGLDYIADFGIGVGFRYLFFLENTKILKFDSGAPVYKITLPKEGRVDGLNAEFGRVGVIVPQKSDFDDKEICNDPKNQLDPVWGLVL